MNSIVAMHEAQRGWWCLWWTCFAAPVVVVVVGGTTSQGQCEVLDLSLHPSTYPLPTNLTVRPSLTDWNLNFNLQEGEAPPAACVRLKKTQSRVQVMLFKGDCEHGTIETYNYLPAASLPLHAWTSLAVDVKDNDVLVTAPSSHFISFNTYDSCLACDALQVTLAQGVEAAVGCRVNCPLYTHASAGTNFKKKVKEWYHQKLYFYFRPGSTFIKVHYEVVCTTPTQSQFQRDLDINPGKEDAASAWHLVELEQQESKAEVHLNNKLLMKIEFPDSCTISRHVIWTVGDAAFTFDCDPREVVEKEEQDSGGKEQDSGGKEQDSGGKEQPVGVPESPWFTVPAGNLFLFIVFVIVFVFISCLILKIYDATQTSRRNVQRPSELRKKLQTSQRDSLRYQMGEEEASYGKSLKISEAKHSYEAGSDIPEGVYQGYIEGGISRARRTKPTMPNKESGLQRKNHHE